MWKKLGMIFTSSKKKENVEFLFGDDRLKISETYSYLGVQFTKKGSFQKAVNFLKEKASKAMYLLKSSLYTGITFQPDLPLKIFDSTVRPILTYGCEIWCIEYFNLFLKPHTTDKTPFEHINNKFCKSIMGLPRQASNFGVKAELGRNTIFSFICGQVLRYWHRIVQMEDDRILKHAYYSELSINAGGGKSWATFVMRLLDLVDKSSMWTNQSSLNDKINPYLLKGEIVESIANIYFDKQCKLINEFSKLRTYKKFKVCRNMEKYVTIKDIPLAWRKVYCAFRISSHDLEIERGRYIRPKKTPEERICKLCYEQPETEIHFVLYCYIYNNDRCEFLKCIEAIDPTFKYLQDEAKFEYLMTSQNVSIIKHVMRYIFKSLKLRKEKLGKH